MQQNALELQLMLFNFICCFFFISFSSFPLFVSVWIIMLTPVIDYFVIIRQLNLGKRQELLGLVAHSHHKILIMTSFNFKGYFHLWIHTIYLYLFKYLKMTGQHNWETVNKKEVGRLGRVNPGQPTFVFQVRCGHCVSVVSFKKTESNAVTGVKFLWENQEKPASWWPYLFQKDSYWMSDMSCSLLKSHLSMDTSV